jgi:hypothetical protein
MDPRTALVLAIKSLEGGTVFPKEAEEAIVVVRQFLEMFDTLSAQAASLDESTAQLLSEGFASVIGVDAVQIRNMVEGAPDDQLQQAAELIEAKLREGGMEPDQLKDEIMAAVQNGDKGEITAILNRMKQNLQKP